MGWLTRAFMKKKKKKKKKNKRKARALIGQLPITICPWVHCEWWQKLARARSRARHFLRDYVFITSWFANFSLNTEKKVYEDP